MKKKMYLVDNRPKFLSVLEFLVQAAVIAVLGLFVAQYLFFASQTASKSMEPTIEADSVVRVTYGTDKKMVITAAKPLR